MAFVQSCSSPLSYRLVEARALYRHILLLRPQQPVVLNHLGTLEQHAATRIGAMTPLFMACKNGNASMIEALLKAG